MFFISCLTFIFLSCLIGTILVGISLGIISQYELYSWVNKVISFNPYQQIILGWLGVFFILVSINFIRRLFLHSAKEKAIVLNTDKGNIKVSLSAIEDMIRKDLASREEISHIRPKVLILRKGIKVLIRAVLKSEENLPEFTAQIQETIKNRLETLIGREKEIFVDLEIKKIALVESGYKKEEKEEVKIPFRNY